MQYFRGILEFEALRDSSVLEHIDGLTMTGAGTVEYHPDARTKSRTVYRVKAPAESIDLVTERLTQEIVDGWYALFWNPENTNEKRVVFRGRAFRLPEQEAEARVYGSARGVQDEYLGFNLPV